MPRFSGSAPAQAPPALAPTPRRRLDECVGGCTAPRAPSRPSRSATGSSSSEPCARATRGRCPGASRAPAWPNGSCPARCSRRRSGHWGRGRSCGSSVCSSRRCPRSGADGHRRSASWAAPSTGGQRRDLSGERARLPAHGRYPPRSTSAPGSASASCWHRRPGSTSRARPAAASCWCSARAPRPACRCRTCSPGCSTRARSASSSCTRSTTTLRRCCRRRSPRQSTATSFTSSPAMPQREPISSNTRAWTRFT